MDSTAAAVLTTDLPVNQTDSKTAQNGIKKADDTHQKAEADNKTQEPEDQPEVNVTEAPPFVFQDVPLNLQ